ncbi:RRXRR domain-containing protein, partial [Candidatus Borrarchaeum sp.]|uniref:RRXRR domain-containing protein n=1 Tax=Candidatus Borrarchaeum sp. TaxID=2846742 RepID=UPI00257CE2F1
MPTTQRTGKKLLHEGKAKVVQRCPFTIQLNYATGETKQPITLGVDIGYTNIGFSAKTEKLEVISGTLILRQDVSNKLDEKRRYRKTRRGRLGYRPPRFNNRTRPEGWLAPST